MPSNIKVHGNYFHDSSKAVDISNDWDGTLDFSRNISERVDQVIHVRDRPPMTDIPPEVADLVNRIVSQSQASGSEVVAQRVENDSRIRDFLFGKGYEGANLRLGVGMLIAAVAALFM